MSKILLNSINLKNLINSAVISKTSKETLGHISDIVIEPCQNRIYALLMQTYSIIPLSRIILYHNIVGFTKGTVIVKSKNSVYSLSSYNFPENTVLYRQEASNKLVYKGSYGPKIPQTSLGIIKNARFDSETGNIQEFIISKQKLNVPWSKNEKIAVNKFRAIDNTIIIE